MSDFNKILRQQCSIELQTNYKILVKSVNNCNSYSGFSTGTQKNWSVHYRQWRWQLTVKLYRWRNIEQ